MKVYGINFDVVVSGGMRKTIRERPPLNKRSNRDNFNLVGDLHSTLEPVTGRPYRNILDDRNCMSIKPQLTGIPGIKSACGVILNCFLERVAHLVSVQLSQQCTISTT